MHKIILDCESTSKKLNRLHNGEKDFIVKSLNIFTSAPTIIMKHSKERHPSFQMHPISWLYSLQRQGTDTTLLPLPCKMSRKNPNGLFGQSNTILQKSQQSMWLLVAQTTHAGYTQQLTFSDGDSLLSVMRDLVAGAAQKQLTPVRSEAPRVMTQLALPATAVCNMIWLREKDGKPSWNLYLKRRFLFLGRDVE